MFDEVTIAFNTLKASQYTKTKDNLEASQKEMYMLRLKIKNSEKEMKN